MSQFYTRNVNFNGSCSILRQLLYLLWQLIILWQLLYLLWQLIYPNSIMITAQDKLTRTQENLTGIQGGLAVV